MSDKWQLQVNGKSHGGVKLALTSSWVPIKFSIDPSMDFGPNCQINLFYFKEFKLQNVKGRARSLEVILNFCNLNSCTLNPKGEGQAKAELSIGGLYLLSCTSCNLIFESLNPKMSSSQHCTEVVNSFPLSASGKYLIFLKCQKNVTHVYFILKSENTKREHSTRALGINQA